MVDVPETVTVRAVEVPDLVANGWHVVDSTEQDGQDMFILAREQANEDEIHRIIYIILGRLSLLAFHEALGVVLNVMVQILGTVDELEDRAAYVNYVIKELVDLTQDKD